VACLIGQLQTANTSAGGSLVADLSQKTEENRLQQERAIATDAGMKIYWVIRMLAAKGKGKVTAHEGGHAPHAFTKLSKGYPAVSIHGKQ
jgi:hypothetical protein